MIAASAPSLRVHPHTTTADATATFSSPRVTVLIRDLGESVRETRTANSDTRFSVTTIAKEARGTDAALQLLLFVALETRNILLKIDIRTTANLI